MAVGMITSGIDPAGTSDLCRTSGVDPAGMSEISRHNSARTIDSSSRVGVPRILRALTGMSRGGEVQNTESIHIVMLTGATDPTTRPWKCMAYAAGSLSVLVVQLIILFAVILESGEPHCVSHAECREGEYCSDNGRCTDCETGSWVGKVTGVDFDAGYCASVTASLMPYDELDYTQVCIGCKFGSAVGSTDAHRDDQGEIDQQTFECFSKWHCDATDGAPGQCDYIELLFVNFTPLRIAVVLCLALCLAVPLAEDMDEASTEDALIEFRVLTRHATYEGGAAHHLAAMLITIVLRCRRAVLPPIVAGVAAISLVAEGFAAMNILLNLLGTQAVLDPPPRRRRCRRGS